MERPERRMGTMEMDDGDGDVVAVSYS